MSVTTARSLASSARVKADEAMGLLGFLEYHVAHRPKCCPNHEPAEGLHARALELLRSATADASNAAALLSGDA